MIILGIDIGGTGIKAAPVNTKTGKLVKERLRIPTPKSATPKAIAKTVKDLVENFKWKGPIGCTFPAVVKKGVLQTAANVDQKWIGINAEKLLSGRTRTDLRLLNDADAAGLAEVKFGAGKNVKGLIAIVTLGTGIGTALFLDGKLVPNTELGHLIYKGKDAELIASERARQKKDLSWKDWGKLVSGYLELLESYVWPDLIIIGGGVSKDFSKFSKYLETKSKVVPAKMLNNAGIVGAALFYEIEKKK